MLQPKKPIKKSNQTTGEFNALMKEYKVNLRKYELDNNPNQLEGETNESYKQRKKYNDFRIKQVEDKNPVKKWYNEMDASQEEDPNFLRKTVRKVATSPIHVANYLHDEINLNDTKKYKSTNKKAKEKIKAGGSALDVLGLATMGTLDKGMKAKPIAEQLLTKGITFFGGNKIQDEIEDGLDKITDYLTNSFTSEKDMKKNKVKNKVPKYNFGTSIENPATALYENQIARIKAQQEGASNPLANGIEIFGNLAQMVGTNLMNKGIAKGEGADGKGVAGFLNKNNGDINSGLGMINAFSQFMAMGGKVGEVPVEVEGKEVGETPDGNLLDFQGPSHEQGGMPVTLPEGTEIYSKRIKIDGVSMADRKKKRERKTVTLESLFEKNKTDALIKNSLERTQQNNQIEEDSDNKIQMVVKQLLDKQENSNLEKHWAGLEVKPKPKLPLNGIIKPLQEKDFLKSWEDWNKNLKNKEPNYTYRDINDINNRKEYQKEIFNTPKYLDLIYNSLDEFKEPIIDGILGDDSYRGMTLYGGYKPIEPISTNPTTKNPNIDFSKMNEVLGGMKISDNASMDGIGITDQEGSFADYTNKLNREYTPSTTSASKDSAKGSEGFKMSNLLGGATFGDMMGMAGNWYQADKIMKTIKENRAGDTPNINAFKDYGKDGLNTLDETKQYVNQIRDKKLKDLELSRTGAIKRNSNSARGINTVRALNLATDAGINNNKEETYNAFAEQMMAILGQQAGMENQRDQVVMGGEDVRDDRDRQDRDNYFSQLITGYKNKGQVISETGRNLNQIKSNDVMQNLINQLSAYGITVDRNGQLSSKGTKKTN